MSEQPLRQIHTPDDDIDDLIPRRNGAGIVRWYRPGKDGELIPVGRSRPQDSTPLNGQTEYLAARIAEYRRLRAGGLTMEEASAALGITIKTAQRTYEVRSA